MNAMLRTRGGAAGWMDVHSAEDKFGKSSPAQSFKRSDLVIEVRIIVQAAIVQQCTSSSAAC